MGFPFLSGFYSKDLIIEILYLNIKFLGIYGYLFSLVAATFTCLYSFRLVYCAFFTDLNFSYNILYKRHNFSIFIVCVLFFLLLGSIFSGYFLKDLLIGLGNNFLDSSIFILFKNYILNDIEFLFLKIKIIPFFIFLFTFYLFFLYIFFDLYYLYLLINEKINFNFKVLKYFYNILSNNLYFDYIYNNYITINFLFKIYTIFIRFIDKGLIELFFIFFLSNNIYKLFLNYKIYVNGNIISYINLIIIFAILILCSTLLYFFSNQFFFFYVFF
jgi:NADH-ubiquinone oxidoreductase chain 5